MEGNQPVLDIGSCPQLLRGTEQDTHLPGAHFRKQLRLFCLRAGFMDKGDFLPGDALFHQFLPHIIVNIKGTVRFRRGEVAENKLCGTLLCCFLPNIKSVLDTAVYLAVRKVRQHIVDKPLIQGTFAPIVGYL